MHTQKNFVEELRWRGLLQDMTPGTEEALAKNQLTGYIGFDPTADSLHIGSLIPIILLMHFHRYGHKPIALVGGATGLIGDPTGKSDERNLLDDKTLEANVQGIKNVLSRFLDFQDSAANAPILLNNADWISQFTFIDFVRDVGKRITVNYMMAKDSVKKRLTGEVGQGMSFTEFTYQLIQGYDFVHLYRKHNCTLQMGGSDQWGNMTTGTELLRRMLDEETEAHALTCPLVTKSDGTKFGKSEQGNIWLDADKTSVYRFYQFWLNVADQDAERFIKYYTFLSQETIEDLIAQHRETPHLRILQKALSEEITTLVHGADELQLAQRATDILFGKSTAEDLKSLSEKTLLDIFEGVPQAQIDRNDLQSDLIELLSDKTSFMSSRGEARRALKENAVSVNKNKVSEDFQASEDDLIAQKYLLLQRGKKNYFLVSIKD
ncbi:MAG: tyrosine--tRNA ligase [Weeksellaceae bacterium]|nr:tyrosine--tRNA ligase [Weeksellaceae bacterium]